jgi:hypothetical protein
MKKLALVACFCLTAGLLSATTIFTNLGPGQSYNNSGYTTSSGSSTPVTFTDGTVFTATASGSLQDILVPIANTIGPLTFGLYSDSSGHPGALLEQWSSVAVPSSLANIPLLTLTSVVHPGLLSGGIYWFVDSGLTGGPFPAGMGWDQNNQGVLGGIWVGSLPVLTQIFSTFLAPAIQLDAVSTPEPTTWLLLGSGLFGLAAWRRRKSF